MKKEVPIRKVNIENYISEMRKFNLSLKKDEYVIGFHVGMITNRGREYGCIEGHDEAILGLLFTGIVKIVHQLKKKLGLKVVPFK